VILSAGDRGACIEGRDGFKLKLDGCRASRGKALQRRTNRSRDARDRDF